VLSRVVYVLWVGEEASRVVDNVALVVGKVVQDVFWVCEFAVYTTRVAGFFGIPRGTAQAGWESE